jgi:hypothetical protein
MLEMITDVLKRRRPGSDAALGQWTKYFLRIRAKAGSKPVIRPSRSAGRSQIRSLVDQMTAVACRSRIAAQTA